MPLPKEVLAAHEANDLSSLEAAIEQYMVKPLKEKNQELLGEKATWKEKAEQSVQERLKEAEKAAGGDTQALLRLKETEWKKEDELKAKRIKELEQDVEEYVVNSSLDSALAGRVASEVRLKDAKRELRTGVKAIRDENGKLQVIAETASGNFPIKQHVDEWLKSDIGKEYAAPPEHKGGGQRNLVTKPALGMPRNDLTQPREAAEYIKKHGAQAYRRAVASQANASAS